MTNNPPSAQILIVDDDPSVQEFVTTLLELHGYITETASSRDEAFKLCEKGSFDLILIDENLPDGSGLDIVRKMNAEGSDCAVIIMSVYAGLPPAVEAIRLDVADYFMKPLENAEDVLARVHRVLEMQLLRRCNMKMVEEICQKDKYLESLVVRDQLTGLYNHAYFHERLENEVKSALRYDRPLSLLLIDLDDFKKINDTLGHQFGDKLLQEFSRIIEGQSRGTDFQFFLRNHEIAARYGGDEFVIILPHTSKQGAASLAERLRNVVENHDFGIENVNIHTVSIGVASLPEDADNRRELIRAADVALYCAKGQGRNRIISYSPEIGRSVASYCQDAGTDYFKRLIALEWSIGEKAFHFVYQPIVKISSKEIYGYEALCRPDHSIFKGPTELYATAQAAGRVQPLGRVLRKLAITPITKMSESVKLFVNLHPQELNDKTLIDLEDYLVPWVKRIVFEVTEVLAIEDNQRVRNVLSNLKDIGFRIAVDDLGSGYSGLQSLAFLNPDYVKLDMKLVRGIDTNPRTARLVKHLCEFATGEGIKIVAEGVENMAECQMVEILGCELAQGYLLAHPGPPFPCIE
ncbi:MAG: diguanylate cyclase [Proteobacteria bacterium]|nr:diguanylate cyclase [Pseudomonadota bacterium]